MVGWGWICGILEFCKAWGGGGSEISGGNGGTPVVSRNNLGDQAPVHLTVWWAVQGCDRKVSCSFFYVCGSGEKPYFCSFFYDFAERSFWTPFLRKKRLPVDFFYVFAEKSVLTHFSARSAERSFWAPCLWRGAPKENFGIFSFYVFYIFLLCCEIIFFISFLFMVLVKRAFFTALAVWTP